jgi:ABC-type antimicrobial peptide transport system permease subunit
MVLRQSLGMVIVGLFVGLGGALAGARVLRGMLFGVAVTDPRTLLGVVGTVLCVALVASAVPVLRAARSDPRVAMERE